MRWQERRNGQVMGTFELRFHVPVEMIDFITDRTTLSRSAAERAVIERWHPLTDDWRQLAVGVGDDIYTVSVDDDENDGVDMYDGPPVIVSHGKRIVPAL